MTVKPSDLLSPKDIIIMPPSAVRGNEHVADVVREIFTYASWSNDQEEAGNRVRENLMAAYMAILQNVPASPSRTRALNMLTDARMLANQAITFGGKV